jgi:hexosaminidase
MPYRGTAVGFSSLCVDAGADATWRFVDDVIGELAAMTPGAYIHIGGDEVQKLSRAQYAAFIARVEKIVANHGKQMIGWEEIANAPIAATTLVQYWTGAGDRVVGKAAVRGSRVVMSPASKAYLDMKYNRRTKLGLNWAGYVDVKDAYNWDPAKLVKGVSADNVEGVEAPLWTETMDTIEDVEFMAFPRVAAIAEIGWSPAEGRDWKDFRARLAAHGRRWDVMGLRYNRSSQIDWGK